ncbi:hypothetical protein [Streptomyces sp. NP-1717]|nr:hypothetical protein [Streptomyces sp. NP-1717]MCI3226927.1 hypothetical protein [Streptomyces sp. NP-1717]WTA73119.1 hypothetical protein OG705_09550 [Streptomyces sp. NBC_00838]
MIRRVFYDQHQPGWDQPGSVRQGLEVHVLSCFPISTAYALEESGD